MNRVPASGKCECDSGLLETNGICLPRCIKDQRARRGNVCYSQCPTSSKGINVYDDPAVSQERSQFDATSGSSTDCIDYSNHLKFKKDGKGLSVKGPTDLLDVPKEFTISFWVYPMTLNSESVFVNAFDRI